MAQEADQEPTAEHVAEEHYSVELAGLTEGAQDQVIDALRDAELDGTLDEVDMNGLMADAANADAARQQAEVFRHEQAAAAEGGDYATAREHARQVEGELADARSQGGRLEEAVRETEHDVVELDQAEWQQQIAEDQADSAEAYAETGDEAAADAHVEDAASSDADAEAYGEEADQGGAYGDQSILTDG